MTGNTLSSSVYGEKSREQRLSDLLEVLEAFTESFLQDESGEPLTAEGIRLMAVLADAAILTERLRDKAAKESNNTLMLTPELIERITKSPEGATDAVSQPGLLGYDVTPDGFHQAIRFDNSPTPERYENVDLPIHNYDDNCPKCFGGRCAMAPFVRNESTPITDII